MIKKILSEFIGTYGLVFAGTSAIVFNDLSGGQITHAGISIIFGLAVTAMILIFGKISGAHINPAVTIALWLARRFRGIAVFPYISSQILGALTGSLSVYLLFSGHPTLGATLPTGTVSETFLLEIFLTFALMLTIFQTTTRPADQGIIIPALSIGAVVAIEAFFAGPLTGASMNPARSIGPAVLSGHIQTLWIYIFAPVLGASLAVWGCRCLKTNGCCR